MNWVQSQTLFSRVTARYIKISVEAKGFAKALLKSVIPCNWQLELLLAVNDLLRPMLGHLNIWPGLVRLIRLWSLNEGAVNICIADGRLCEASYDLTTISILH